MQDEQARDLLSLLANRLEHLSADSHWARRASGLRGNILKVLAQIENGERIKPSSINVLEERAFYLLNRAAQEIPDQEIMEKNK